MIVSAIAVYLLVKKSDRFLLYGLFNLLEDANPQLPNNCELPVHLHHR
ncbi:hypothetical protein PQG02_10560 [Nostoc sp. UHCC 0926]|nr:hypothetical protein [Nostoc sp. UHCC 0926]WDD34725.1 hypothetical protein PQG02_10560 [Nostoc sp. UHCC 0926]